MSCIPVIYPLLMIVPETEEDFDAVVECAESLRKGVLGDACRHLVEVYSVDDSLEALHDILERLKQERLRDFGFDAEQSIERDAEIYSVMRAIEWLSSIKKRIEEGDKKALLHYVLWILHHIPSPEDLELLAELAESD